TRRSSDLGTAVGYGSDASGAYGLAVGGIADYGELIIGLPGFILQTAEASGVASTALGNGAWATELGATSAGTLAEATGVQSTALGTLAVADSDGASALGSGSYAAALDSTAVGFLAYADAENSVALGANSYTDRANTVSVGDVGSERQITNVAAGTEGTDAADPDHAGAATA